MSAEIRDSKTANSGTLKPGQHVRLETNNGTPMALNLTNESDTNRASYAVFATIDGTEWSDADEIPPTGQKNFIEDFKGNSLIIFNMTNVTKQANIDYQLVGI